MSNMTILVQPAAFTRRWVWLLAAGCLAVTGQAVQFSETPRRDFWVPVFPVFDLAEDAGILYLWGSFESVGPASPKSTAVDLASGAMLPGYPAVEGSVSAVASDLKGGWYVGGRFLAIGGVVRTNLAHVFSDGRVDPDWRPRPGGWLGRVTLGSIGQIAVSPAAVYVGGSFGEFGGVARPGIAALDPISGQPTAWNPASGQDVRYGAFVLAGESIVASVLDWGGGTNTLTSIQAVDAATGRRVKWSVPVRGLEGGPAPALDPMVATSDTLYLSGSFGRVGGQERLGLAALEMATGKVKPWNPPPPFPYGQVRAVYCNTVYISGWVSFVGGAAPSYLAALDGETGQLTGWNSGPNDWVEKVEIPADHVLVQGSFTEIGGQVRHGLALLDLASGRATSWNPVLNFRPQFSGLSADRLYAGGQSLTGVARHYAAALDARTGRPTDWQPAPVSLSAGFFGYAMVAGRGKVFIPTESGGVAAFDSRTSGPPVWTVPIRSAEGGGRSLAMTEKTLWVTGDSFEIGGQHREGLAALEMDSGAVLPLSLTMTNGGVWCLSAIGDTAFIGGTFTQVNGLPRDHLAAINPNTGTLKEWEPRWTRLSNIFFVAQLVALPDRLLVRGRFQNRAGELRQLAALDAATGVMLDWDPNPTEDAVTSNGVTSICAVDDTVYVAGDFTAIGGRSQKHLAAVDLITGRATSWSPYVENEPGAAPRLVRVGDSLALAGYFIAVSGQFTPNLAVFPPLGSPEIQQQPRGQNLFRGETIRLAPVMAGEAPSSYQWRRNETNLIGATNSALVIPNARIEDSGAYTVLVTNRLGLVRSLEADVLVIVPPVVTVQPVSQTVAPGAIVALAVTATGNPPPLYQWRLNGVNLPGEHQSTLIFTNAQPANGGSYSLVAANLGGAVSSDVAELVVTAPPLLLADTLSERGLTNSFSGVGRGNNANASRESGEPLHAGQPGRKSLWYAWVPTAGGVARISTRGSSFDTLLAVYTNAVPAQSATVTQLGMVASDDDRGGFLTSEVAFNAMAGVEYLIAVDGLGKGSGNIVLGWNLEPGLSEVPRIFQPPLSQTVGAGSQLSLAVTAFSARPLTYQWYFNCFPVYGATNPTLALTNVEPEQVGSYRVRVSNGQREIESAPAYLQLNFSGELGTVQKVASRDKLAGAGLGAQSPAALGSPPGPALQGLQAGNGGGLARGFSGVQVFNTFGASKEIGEPNHCGEPGGASAWFSVLAEDNGVMLVSTEGSDACAACGGTDFDPVLAVYAGPANPLGFDDLTLVTCDKHGGLDGRSSRLTFDAVRGQAYHVAVDGVNGAQGRVRLSYRLGQPPSVLLPPQPQTARTGDSVVLNVTVTNSPPWGYLWRFNGVDLPGATNATLVLTSVSAAQAGKYSCLISNFAGMATSVEAEVRVEPGEPLRLQAGGFRADGAFRVLVEGARLGTVIEASTDASRWQPLHTNSVTTTNRFEMMDSLATNHSLRLYRSVW